MNDEYTMFDDPEYVAEMEAIQRMDFEMYGDLFYNNGEENDE